jgi:hypothetical protein
MLLLYSTLLFTHPTSTTLFPLLSKLVVSVLSFEELTDNSNISTKIWKVSMSLATLSKLIILIVHSFVFHTKQCE